MKNDSLKELYLEYFICQELFYQIINFLPFWCEPIKNRKVIMNLDVKERIENLLNIDKRLDLNQSRFKELLISHINASAKGEKPSKSLENYVKSYLAKIENKIHNIPNDLDKAYNGLLGLVEVEISLTVFPIADQIYDAMVLLDDKIHSDIIEKVLCDWKERSKSYKEKTKDSPIFGSDIFWTSRDFQDTIDGVSRYKFCEHFEIGEFESTFEDVEGMLAESLLKGSSGNEAIAVSFFGDTELTSISFDLWLISRSRNFPNRIRDVVNLALIRIANNQFIEGYWTDFIRREKPKKDSKSGIIHSKYLPSICTTALCSLNLLKLSISDSMREKGILGAKYLLGMQNSDGGWNNEIESKPEIFTTLLSLEALIRSGIKNIKRSVNLGINWILNQQNKLGFWEENGLPFPFLTVLVLEFLKFRDFYPKKSLDLYQLMSKSFLNRSMQFSLEGNSNSHRLAILISFQGIEFFLYSVLEDSKLNISIFESSDKTIGMRKALIKFQTYLQDEKYIKKNEVIKYRNSLDKLAYFRDQIVHKGIGVSQKDCRDLIDEAFKFASKYSNEIFKFNIFI